MRACSLKKVCTSLSSCLLLANLAEEAALSGVLAEHGEHLDALVELRLGALLGELRGIDLAEALAGGVLLVALAVGARGLGADVAGGDPSLAGGVLDLGDLGGKALNDGLLLGADLVDLLAARLQQGAGGAALAGGIGGEVAVDADHSATGSGLLLGGGDGLSDGGLLGNSDGAEEGQHGDGEEDEVEDLAHGCVVSE